MQNTCIGRHVFALAFALAMSLSPANSEQRGEADPQEELPDFTVQEVAGPFEFPWSLAFLPDGRILITERAGRLQIVDPPTARKARFQDCARTRAKPCGPSGCRPRSRLFRQPNSLPLLHSRHRRRVDAACSQGKARFRTSNSQGSDDPVRDDPVCAWP